jgi:hypothetical protein
VTLLCVVHFKMGVLGFGVAQAAYGASHFISLVFTTWASTESLHSFLPAAVPRPSVETGRYFHLPMVSTALHMTGTSLLKHLLTEGDRIVLSFAINHYDQGIYAVTYNYGSLVARLLFQPIEESSRISYAQLAGEIQTSESAAPKATTEGAPSAAAEERKALVGDLRSMILVWLQVMFFFGHLLALFGPLYARLLVKVVLGERWYSEETVQTISAFCVYLGIMGCNGVSEAFVQSVAPTQLFGTMNRSLFLSSLVFYTSSPLLISYYGTVGLIIANCLSMLLRTLLNLHFISSYFAEQQSHPPLTFSAFWKLLIPSSRFLPLVRVYQMLADSSSEYAHSNMTLEDAAWHLFKGAVLTLISVAIYGFIFRQELGEWLRAFRGNKDQTQTPPHPDAPPPPQAVREQKKED